MKDLWEDGYGLETVLNLPTFEESTIRPPNETPTREVTEAIRTTISKLSRFFSIEKASLAYFNFGNQNLHVTHIYKSNRLNKGLTIIVQPENSVMYQVLMQNYPVADNYPDHISTHVIERKILLSDKTKSVLIIPLTYDCYKLGILTLSSQEECAFGTYLEGVGEGPVKDLSAALYINQATPS
jgi:transcriptional regulator with GAF, ATPase, and Fis domain